ncbi:MAG: hypothetical protein JOZ43_03485 [Acidobacteriales bacterium]|nr:hypothetical protein [Terriglobales bacterium]
MRWCALVALLIWGSSSAIAQNCHDDGLEKQEPAAKLYAASPFLHGYRDGYQQGFHDVDVEMQFAHPLTSWRAEKHFKKVEWRSEFGDKRSYVNGYRAGYERGYRDMLADSDMRVIRMMQQISPESGPAGIDLAAFNAGVVNGYADAGRSCSETSGDFCSGLHVGELLAKQEVVPERIH